MKETLYVIGIDDAFLISDFPIRRYGCITGSQDRRSGDQKAWSI